MSTPATLARFGDAAPGSEPPGSFGLTLEQPAEKAHTGRWARLSRPKRWAIVTVAAAVSVGGAGYAGFVEGRTTAPVTQTATVLATVQPVPAGARLNAQGIGVVRVVAGPATRGFLGRPEMGSAVGAVTRSVLPAGTILAPADLRRSGAALQPGLALVGIGLKPGQMPTGGVNVGDIVEVVAVPPGQQGHLTPVLLAARAPVWSVTQQGSGTTSVVVLVPVPQAGHLAAYANGGNVAIVRLGTPPQAAP
ncbi:MAG: SAF domain-containing protein [Acidimicrobiales bacterium]